MWLISCRACYQRGQPVSPLGHHFSRALRPGPALCPDPWVRVRSRQITALGEQAGLVRTWGLGGPQTEEIPPGLWRWPSPRLPSLVDSVSLLVSENKGVTVYRLAVWTLSLVLGGPRWPGPGPRDGIWVTSPRVCVGWAAGIPGLGLAPRTWRLRDGAQGVLSASVPLMGPPPVLWPAQRVCGLEGSTTWWACCPLHPSFLSGPSLRVPVLPRPSLGTWSQTLRSEGTGQGHFCAWGVSVSL